ncbi:RNA pseudouridine synthase superfamily protein [Besnoitia besnoiti]|uniref:RNA pseudouridine synthase superfamily protein n=1 Tax=Besnoitia besnoiti TaxID=94643 RepID=A0A2A9MH98_BESBE|nr:RNA pseudouridine synthase superfamily protein [Besnoitia besnoiti]PFH34782.1 RNA pseudouridine synthase superfamily protein [Besnoitia besnoiti]
MHRAARQSGEAVLLDLNSAAFTARFLAIGACVLKLEGPTSHGQALSQKAFATSAFTRHVGGSTPGRRQRSRRLGLPRQLWTAAPGGSRLLCGTGAASRLSVSSPSSRSLAAGFRRAALRMRLAGKKSDEGVVQPPLAARAHTGSGAEMHETEGQRRERDTSSPEAQTDERRAAETAVLGTRILGLVEFFGVVSDDDFCGSGGFRSSQELASTRRLSFKRVEEAQSGLRAGAFALRHIVGSWPALAQLLHTKELFVVPRDTSFAHHVKLIQSQRERRDGCKDVLLRAGDLVYFPRGADILHHTKEIARPAAGLDLKARLLFKDTDFLAIDKPFGLATRQSRPRSSGRGQQKDTEGSSVFSLLHQLRFSMDETPKLLHRLGDEVTGVLLLGRSRQTAQLALDRFRSGSFGVVTFYALVHGHPPGGHREGIIRIPLAENEAGLMVPKASQRGGAVAVTHWRLLKTTSARSVAGERADDGSATGLGFSLLELEIHQQQCRHQARAHCLYGLSCPIVGDRVYGPLASRWRQLASTGASSLGGEGAALLGPRAGRCVEKADWAGEARDSDSETRERGTQSGSQQGGGARRLGAAERDEEKLRTAEVRRALGLTAPSMLHLHSRAIRFKTFAGRPVRIEAPFPPHLRQAAARLGWSFFVERADAHLAAWHVEAEEPAAEFAGKDVGGDAEAAEGKGASIRRQRQSTAAQRMRPKGAGGARDREPSVWDILGSEAEGDADYEEEDELWNEASETPGWQMKAYDDSCGSPAGKIHSGRRVSHALSATPEKHWIARFFEEKAKQSERQIKAAARRPAPLPPVMTKLHR